MKRRQFAYCDDGGIIYHGIALTCKLLATEQVLKENSDGTCDMPGGYSWYAELEGIGPLYMTNTDLPSIRDMINDAAEKVHQVLSGLVGYREILENAENELLDVLKQMKEPHFIDVYGSK